MVTALPQRIGRCGKQFGMAVWRQLIGRIQTIKMRNMPVVTARVVAILKPLLQLSVTSYLHRG